MRQVIKHFFNILLIAAVIMPAFATIGCEDKKPGSRPVSVEKKASKGPVSLVVTANRDFAAVAQPITLTIEAVAQKGVQVKFVKPEKTLGDFQIISHTDDVDIPVDQGNKRLWKRTLVLESFSSGEKKIPAIKVDFEDKRDPAKPINTEVQAEGFSLRIDSVIKGKPDPLKPRDIKGVVELTPKPDYTWLWYVTGTLAAIAVGVMAVRYFIRRKIMRALNAGEWAIRQLAILEGEHLPEAGKVEQFYVRLTGVVRQYIERRFAIAAPKLTTREFLDEVQQRKVFDETRRAGLQEFLNAADMVKFAHFTPGGDEVDNSMESAREFVIDTAAKNEKEARV